MKSRIAIILTVMMIISLFEVVGVFANSEQGAEPEMTTESADVSAATNPTTVPAPVLEAYASYQCVHFMWAPVKVTDASTGTEVEVDGYKVAGKDIPKDSLKGSFYDGKYHYTVSAAPGASASLTVKAYKNQVVAVGDSTSTPLYSEPATVSGNAVQNGLYRIKIKKGGKLKSHGGPKRTISVYKGQYIYAYGFGGGKYIFKDGDSIFYCNKSRTSKRSVVYQRNWDYSNKEAECFVNDRGMGSGTGSLVWVNVYCQHMYLFTRNAAGRWACVDSWDCSTGKASSPAPTGVSGQKTIWKKIRKRHGIPYWSCYSDINSIHGKKKKWKMGKPNSNGCIRNPNEKAQEVYTQAGKGTRVYIY